MRLLFVLAVKGNDCISSGFSKRFCPGNCIVHALLRDKAFDTCANHEVLCALSLLHSRKKDPSEIFGFVKLYREWNQTTPIVVVPTSFNTVTEEEFKEHGVNVVIYANQLTRTGFPAMQNAAKMILANHRAKECDDVCMPFKEIIRLIPEDM